METKQAHSNRAYPGRDAALRRPPSADSYDAAQQHSRTAQRAAPTLWLNLVCLDAPIVSVSWLWLFARTFHLPVGAVDCTALFLTAWLIYLGDRLADSLALPAGAARSLRHEFCLNHRHIWLGALTVLAAVDAVLIWQHIGTATFVAGAVVGTLALIHLAINHSLGGAWPPLPLKEIAVGFLFAAGTLVPLCPVRLTTAAFLFTGIAFAWLCTLNCVSIAYWERELDERQQKVSCATRYPGLGRYLGIFSIVLALGSGLAAIVNREAAPILGCVSMSSLLLGWLDFSRGEIERDQRTALADLVLLTPWVALLVMNS